MKPQKKNKLTHLNNYLKEIGQYPLLVEIDSYHILMNQLILLEKEIQNIATELRMKRFPYLKTQNDKFIERLRPYLNNKEEKRLSDLFELRVKSFYIVARQMLDQFYTIFAGLNDVIQFYEKERKLKTKHFRPFACDFFSGHHEKLKKTIKDLMTKYIAPHTRLKVYRDSIKMDHRPTWGFRSDSKGDQLVLRYRKSDSEKLTKHLRDEDIKRIKGKHIVISPQIHTKNTIRMFAMMNDRLVEQLDISFKVKNVSEGNK